jgi:hypothetical protein
MFRTNEYIKWYEVECESLESIHNHSAYAYQQEWREEWESALAAEAAIEDEECCVVDED